MAQDSSRVSFLTPLPGDPPAQQELTALVKQGLAGLPGSWKVGVTPGPHAGAVIVTARRDDGFECSVFMDGSLQRTFLYLRDQVANALQLHVLGIPRPPSGLAKPKR